ncbi:MAG TPA: hypothetical protein PKY30_17530, partial [Myxococcota bacterium]|nr:hypothetical protein [Myxococcota bacterium]
MKEGRGFLLVLVVTAVLYLPLLRLGFLAAFFWFLPMEDPDPSWAPNVVDFATARERWSAYGLDAWWGPADFRWALWRPLSNALLELQWRFFGAEGMGYHGLSLGFYLLLLLPVWRLYRGFLNPLPALLALSLFAAHFGHLQSIWFHSNQHSLLSVLPALLALLAHRHGREGGGRRWGLVAPLLLVLALASGESALGMVSYFLAYELFVSKDTFQKRAASLVPVVGLCGLYLVAHSALGYQTRGSLVYLDPAAEPL